MLTSPVHRFGEKLILGSEQLQLVDDGGFPHMKMLPKVLLGL